MHNAAHLPKVPELKHPNSCHWLYTQQQNLTEASTLPIDYFSLSKTILKKTKQTNKKTPLNFLS